MDSNRILVCLDDEGNFILILERFLNYFKNKLKVNEFTKENEVLILNGFKLSEKESDMVVIDVTNGTPPPPPPPPRMIVVKLGNTSNIYNRESLTSNDLFQRITEAIRYLVVLGNYFNGNSPQENQPKPEQPLDQAIFNIIENFIKGKKGEGKNGGKKVIPPTICKSPSSRRGRPSTKKRCTKRKPKRRQHRASRRVY
jgi:hypothetical protein